MNDKPKEEEEVVPPVLVSIPEQELEQIKNDAETYRDKYLRLLAEADNTRKRLSRESQELIQRAVQNVVLDFLNPIDHLENALRFTEHASEETRHWALGFQMILNQFKDALATQGVVGFDSVGEPFDPHQHEAVEVVPTDEQPPGTVLTESVRGYKMGNKTIRPARVTVSKASINDQQTEEGV